MTTTTFSIANNTNDPLPQLAQAIAALNKVIHTKPEAEKLLQDMVGLCGQALAAAAAGIWITEKPDHPELLLEHELEKNAFVVDRATIPGLILAVRRCVREAKPLIVPPFFRDTESGDIPVNPSQFELLILPMRLHGNVAMVFAIAVPRVTDVGLHRAYIQFLQRMVGAVEASMAERHISMIEKDRGTSGKLVTFAEQVHKHLFVQDVATDLSNLTRDVIAAERVTVELYPGPRKKALAVSNVDEPNKRASMFQAQRLILDYVHDREVPVVLDRGAAKQIVSDPALQDAATGYFAASTFDAFTAAPIKEHEKIIGVIVAEYKTSEAAQQQTHMLADLARIASGSVVNAIEYENIPLRKPLHAIRKLLKKPTANRKYFMLTVGIILIAITGVLSWPMDFSIKTDCVVQPVSQLSIVAPMNGQIIEVPVHAGEHVYAPGDAARLPFGQTVKPLMVFDTTDLQAQLAEQKGKDAELQVALKDVQNKGDLSKVGATHLQLNQVEDQIKLLNHQISQATVYSPIEAVVLTEHPEAKKYSTARVGEPELEIASFSDWVLMVDVPESDVALVRGALARASKDAENRAKPDQGIAIEYILYPWPDQRYSVHARGVATLLPASIQSKTANVFRLQIQLNAADLPPGIAMSGVTGRAKVNVGKAPLIYQWTRGLRRLLQMTVFM